MDAGRSGNSPARLEGRTKIVALLRAIVSLGVVTVLVPTGGKPAAGGIYTVTDRALGLSLTVPRTWIREPAGKFAPGYLAFVRPQPGRQEGITELVVEPLGVTKVRDPRRVAHWAQPCSRWAARGTVDYVASPICDHHTNGRLHARQTGKGSFW
jgi:hypothetical protein